MKSLTVTFHHTTNYGALFQMFALHSKIKAMGHDNLVLETKLPSSKKRKKSYNPKVFLRNMYMNYCKKIRKKEVNALYKSFADFKKNHVAFTRPYTSMEDLKNNPPEVDCMITGSDQVWNMTTVPSMIPSRFLDFGNPNAIRFSFAASIENMKYSDEQKKYAKQQLKRFKGISLREKSACDFIASFTECQPRCLLDPVFLFDKNEWRSISKEPRINGPYILCYQVLSNKLMQKVVNKLKKETGYPVVAICNVPFKWIRADYSFFDVSPEEFLGLYDNAACVVTTSFHGTAFGVLFNKTTYTIPKSISSNRINDLMHLMGLDAYVITDVKTVAKTPIDWDKVNEVIEREREGSVGFLHEMMG